MNSEMTFEQLAKDKPGTIYDDGYANGVRYLIMRGPASLCAYVGVPLDHPLAGFDYDSIVLDVHGGLTFSREGKEVYPVGWYWYGWDYGHAGDKSFYDLEYGFASFSEGNDTEWTVDQVRAEVLSATYDFSRLKSVAERIYSNALTRRAELDGTNEQRSA